MTTASQVLAIAASQLGYNRWDDPEPGTKYGRWYAAKTGSPYFGASGVPFCAMGVSWVLDQASTQPPGGPFAYVPFGINAAAREGRLVDPRSAQPGDLVCFDWDDDGEADHVGFVELNQGTHLQTIEFNTSGSWAGSQSNGGGVYRRTRDWDSVCAMIRPAYDDVASSSGGALLVVDAIIGPASIRRLQEVLGTPQDSVISSQYAPNADYVPAAGDGWEWTGDGEGSAAIAELQRRLGVTDDGLIGPDTIHAWQHRLGVTADGYLGPETAAAIQTALNEGRLW